MKTGWQIRPLGEVCSFISRGISPSYVDSGGIRVLNQKCIRDHSVSFELARRHDTNDKKVGNDRLIQAGDVLVNSTGTGTLGRVAQMREGPLEPTTVDSHVTIVRPSPGKFYLQFFGYMLVVIEDAIKDAGEGCGGQTELARSVLAEKFSAHFPESQSEQRRIVGVLDEAFDAIATAQANAEQNLQNALSLIQSFLTAAVTGRLTRDWRHIHSDTENAAVHLKENLTQRRSEWKGSGRFTEPEPPVTDSPVDLPNSWALASTEQLSTHIVDCPHSTPKWTKTGEMCLRTTNFKPGLLDLESVQFVSKETYRERILRLEPKPGDVLYSREGGILGIACVIPTGLKACLGQRMMQFRLDTSIALPQYFAAVLNSQLILSEVRRLIGGAAAPHLNIRDIRTFPIPLPPIAEQYKIVEKLESFSTETKRLESIYQQKLAALNELKKSLLNQAFSGAL